MKTGKWIWKLQSKDDNIDCFEGGEYGFNFIISRDGFILAGFDAEEKAEQEAFRMITGFYNIS